jgi:hypothetical protein
MNLSWAFGGGKRSLSSLSLWAVMGLVFFGRIRIWLFPPAKSIWFVYEKWHHSKTKGVTALYTLFCSIPNATPIGLVLGLLPWSDIFVGFRRAAARCGLMLSGDGCRTRLRTYLFQRTFPRINYKVSIIKFGSTYWNIIFNTLQHPSNYFD